MFNITKLFIQYNKQANSYNICQLFSNMKSLANDIRIMEGKTQQSVQDNKGVAQQVHKKMQQLMEANTECQNKIKLLQKQAEKLEEGNKQLDQQLQIKKAELEKAKQEIEQQEQKEQGQGQNEMQDWITHVQNYSGVPQEVIDSLICLEYEGPAQDQQICLSCYQPMQVGAQCKYLPCCHLYHSECINNHLKVNKLCPACGQAVSQ